MVTEVDTLTMVMLHLLALHEDCKSSVHIKV
ncbi:hypothetical protein LINPERHAP2_LOCUS3444 [Linum perenne]